MKIKNVISERAKIFKREAFVAPLINAIEFFYRKKTELEQRLELKYSQENYTFIEE